MPAKTNNELPLQAEWGAAKLSFFGQRNYADGAVGDIEIQVTVSKNSPEETIDQIMSLIQYCEENYGLKPHRILKPAPQQPTLSPVPVAAGNPAPIAPAAGTVDAPEPVKDFELTHMFHATTEKGKSYLKVFGGWFTKFGLPVWPENVPEAAQSFTQWKPGEPHAMPDTMKFAKVQGKKVLGFHS